MTHGISVAEPPGRVWPWIVQMGAGRGGWYSYDRIDNGGRPSAERILPEHQHLEVGDIVPGLPDRTDVFVVGAAEPGHHLVLVVPRRDGTTGATWTVHLASTDDGTRILIRMRLGPAPLHIPAALVRLAFEPAHLVMQRRQLHGIARRVASARPTGSAPHPSAALLRRRTERGLSIVAEGTSMLPTIEPGSTLRIEAAQRPRAGEVWALVHDDGEVVVHRHWRRTRHGLIFRGDGNDHPDPPVNDDQLVGRVDLGRADRLRGLTRLTTLAVRRRLSRR
ncbi:MAG: S24 family peptidase [Actinomycetota bacterium]